MLLNRQFNLFAIVASFTLVASIFVTGVAVQQVRVKAAHVAQAESTMRGVSGFRYLAMETVLYGEPRARQQWHKRVLSFQNVLDSHTYDEAEENVLLAREKAGLAVLDRLFMRIERNPPATTGRRSSAITSALFLTSQKMLDDGFELMQLNRHGLEQAYNRALWCGLSSLLALALMIVAVGFIIKRRVLLPVAALHKVTEQVMAGAMGARVNLFAPDEIGLLGRTFDQMTTQLEKSQVAMQREIAERRGAQSALSQAQDDLQAIIDHMPALVVYWDKDLKNRFANRASIEWFGLTPEQMRGRHIADLIGAERFADIAPYLESVLSGNSELFERPLTLASGEERYALLSYTPDAKSGRIDGLYGVISDVTPLKRAQAGQAQALLQLQSIVNAASDFAIIETDVEGTIKLFSSGAEHMLGYAASEMVNCSTPALLHLPEEMVERAAEMSAQCGRTVSGFDVFVSAARDGASESRDWTFVRKDGTQLPVNLTVTAVRGPSAEIVGYLGIAKDVRAERDIRRVLAEARDLALQASLSKSQFLANMSHEIRTPMNAVLGMLELLQYTSLTPLQLDYATKSKSAARSLLGLLNDILDFSQVEANKVELESEPFAIETMLRELAPILSALLGTKAVELVFSIDPALAPWLQGDVTRLRQVLINLTSNAIKFTAHGEVVVALRLRRSDTHGSAVEFSVRDTGIGIAADKIESIFDDFTQAEPSTTRRFGGTGLGLTISQRLVNLMGGQLQVESTVHEGSCFHFCITFPHPAPERVQPPPNAVALPAHQRVLVVDDSATARTVLAASIAALGWRATAVGSGAQALCALDESVALNQPYDVVLLDWRMPEMDGWELASQIHGHGGATPIVVMITAQGRGTLVERDASERDLLSGFLTKPVTTTMLRDAILEAQSGRSTLSAPVPLARRNRLAGLHVLVIDDNAMNQQVARELLVLEGAQVCVADGGELGLAMADAAIPPFDAILLDIQMPGMDGYTCARAMRASDRLKLTPIVAMTANAMPPEREACLAAGMNAHMSKPIDIDTVVEVLLAHCRIPAASAASAPKPLTPAAPLPLRPVGTAIEIGPALARLGGNQALFVALSRTFSGEAAQFMAALQVALPAEDLVRSADLLHTFRSAAGMMGATALQDYIAQLERRLRNKMAVDDAGVVLAEMAHLVSASTTELVQIAAALSRSRATPTLTPSQLSLAGLLEQLDGLLSTSDMRALDVFSTIELYHGAQLDRRLSLLGESIAQLDFALARRQCHQLQAELE